MLNFYLEPKPHDFVREGMVDEAIPAGNFYAYSLTMAPQSVLPQRFILETNTFVPVKIYNNNALVKTHLPKSSRDVVLLPLAKPPATNNLFVTNDIDAPVNLTVTISYFVTLMDAMAEQLFEVAGRANDQYLSLATSPWYSFIIDWLLPWSNKLPDIQSVRSIALKSAANNLFGRSGSDGAVRAMVSIFSSTTPVVHRSRNPTVWQPEIYQPYASGDDVLGWDFHVWIPNLCTRRWAAFIGYINNNPKWDFVHFSEEAVMLRQRGTEYYRQIAFDTSDQACSFRNFLNALGCLDRLTAAGSISFSPQSAMCFWAHPSDQTVEYPGIGGLFFDSGKDFDGGWVELDSLYDIDLKTDYWVGASLSRFFGGIYCFTVYSDTALLPKDQDCCYEGPDTKILTTMRMDATVTSTVKPNHPVFGGDDPGILPDPYFGIFG